MTTEPGLMTYEEYYGVINGNSKTHPSSAYDYDLAAMNAFGGGRDEHPILLNRLHINGLWFEVRRKNETYGSDIGIFENGRRVAFATDEWGCMLIAVASEYRGFGLGPILRFSPALPGPWNPTSPQAALHQQVNGVSG